MSLEILFVEDNPHKRARIVEYVSWLDPSIRITQANSFTSGSQALSEMDFDLILLDISLPTYDRAASESGGRFRTLAGREIARRVVRSDINTRILFITQFASFSDKGASFTFDSLNQELQVECGAKFAGMVFYDSSQSAWKEGISKVIKATIK